MENVYDNAGFFEQYKEMRAQQINANNLIENPIIKSMLPSLDGKTILDLGCGDGNMGHYFLQNGAKSVLGVDISENMLAQAEQNNTNPNLSFKLLKMEDISTLDQKFDIIYSSLAFHYVQDINKLLSDINNLLTPGGTLIFSQESPLVTATIFESKNPEKKLNIDGKQYFLLSDYGNESVRNNYWNDVPVTKYHRTYATMTMALLNNNFNIVDIKDSFATEETIRLYEKYKNQKDRPYFTFFKATKK